MHLTNHPLSQKSFTPDTRFAWATIRIPERVYHGDDQNHWFPLSGLSGVDTEGQINLLFTLLVCTFLLFIN